MKLHLSHPWKVTTAEAREIQDRIRSLVEIVDRLEEIRIVAGVDVGFEEAGAVTRAAVALLRFPSLEPAGNAIARTATAFPYIPGLLSFREIPAIVKAMEQLEALPDLLLCDGQGIAHPRRCGIASHLGVLLDIPSIGVAKTRLTGTHGALSDFKGSRVPLMDGDEQIGSVLRTRTGVKPLYVSPGHRISIATAEELVLRCTTRYRLPETTRQAHRLASGPAKSR